MEYNPTIFDWPRNLTWLLHWKSYYPSRCCVRIIEIPCVVPSSVESSSPVDGLILSWSICSWPSDTHTHTHTHTCRPTSHFHIITWLLVLLAERPTRRNCGWVRANGCQSRCGPRHPPPPPPPPPPASCHLVAGGGGGGHQPHTNSCIWHIEPRRRWGLSDLLRLTAEMEEKQDRMPVPPTPPTPHLPAIRSTSWKLWEGKPLALDPLIGFVAKLSHLLVSIFLKFHCKSCSLYMFLINILMIP